MPGVKNGTTPTKAGHSARYQNCVLNGISALSLLAFTQPALAQSNVSASDRPIADEDANVIVVTAQRRQELSRDVPITITSVNSQALGEANIKSLTDLPKLVPGIRVDQSGSYTQPTIRGIGTTLVQTGIGSSVGVYVDGFYLPNSLALDFDFANVRDIQVLKGPQGTLFGRNTTGGAILITTAQPSTETSAIVEASYERFDARQVKAYVTTGLSDAIAFSVEGQFSKGDGFVRNIYDGSLATGGGFAPGANVKHPGAYEKWSVRTGLKVELSDGASVLLRYAHSDNSDPSGYMATPYYVDGIPYTTGDLIPGTVFTSGRRTIAHNARNYFRIKSDTFQLTGDFDLGFADLTSYTQYREESIGNLSDNDRSAAAMLALSLPERDKIMSQEFLLTSRPGSRLQYTAGIFLFQHQIHADVDLAAGSNNFFAFSATGAKVRTFAGFFDGTYEVANNLFVTGGIRLSRDEVRNAFYQTLPGVPGVYTFQPDFTGNRISPRVVVRYKPDDYSSLYASYTRGYKSAIPDYRRTSAATGSTFKDANYLKPEDIDAFEVGYKYAHNDLTLDFSAFWYEYKNLQTGYYRIAETILSNAAKARIKGVEAAVDYEPFEGFQISAAATYLDAKYRSYPVAGFFNPTFVPDNDGDGRPEFSGFDTSVTQDASGNLMPKTAKFTGNVSARYTTDVSGGRFIASANLHHTSKMYFDPANQFGQPGYSIVSARLQWTDPSQRYTLAVYGDNLLDKTYLRQIAVGSGAAGIVWGKPRTYGLSLRVEI